MNDDVNGAIDEVANSLQVINLLSTRLRQDLGESAQHAIDLEGATARAVRAIKRLQPTKSRSVRKPIRYYPPGLHSLPLIRIVSRRCKVPLRLW